MTDLQILKILLNERDCINRQVEGGCDRQCQLCDLRLEDKDILEVYDCLISEYREKLEHKTNAEKLVRKA